MTTTTTSIIVLSSDKQPIGAIQSLTIREDGSNPKLTIDRMRLDRSKLEEMFQKGHLHVASQIYPVHIVVLEDKVETIRATNVWISEIAASYTSGEWVLSEGIEAECEKVSGTITKVSSGE